MQNGKNLVVPCEKYDTLAASEKLVQLFFSGDTVTECISIQSHKLAEEPQSKEEKSFFHHPTVKVRIYTVSPKTPDYTFFHVESKPQI